MKYKIHRFPIDTSFSDISVSPFSKGVDKLITAEFRIKQTQFKTTGNLSRLKKKYAPMPFEVSVDLDSRAYA